MTASMLNVGFSDSEPFKIRTNLIATGRTCVIGASGSGKSSVVAVLCEELCRQKVPFAIIDIEGEYPGLKKAYEAIWIGDADDADVTWKEVDIEALANVKAEAPRLYWISAKSLINVRKLKRSCEKYGVLIVRLECHI